ncbi:unnamed protein product [Closterium sp. Yama58-4]|nr:unnamed protein product [Closterium sp. Yama58-4]
MATATAAAYAAATAAANAAASTPVFVYGTLMADEVLHALLDRVPTSAPARLPNFTRHSIKGRQYPAVVPKAQDSVMGKLLLNLSPPEMSLFDAFEDVEYVRSTHPVSLQGLITQPDTDLYGSWDYEAWRTKWLDSYVAMCREFAQEWKEGGSWSGI